MRLMVDEIVNTSTWEKSVGAKVLAVSIPKVCVERQIETGGSAMMARPPQKETVTFTYFEPKYSDLQQYGPTTVCGEFAFTNIETKNDPAIEYQSIEFKILAGPKTNPT